MSSAIPENTSCVTLAGPRGKLPFHVFANPISLDIARSILAGLTYPSVPIAENVLTVLDIGANVGAATLLFAILYPNATVYALEPASGPFAVLRQNVESCANVRAFPFGLYSASTRLPLYFGLGDSVESSIHPSSRTTAQFESVALHCAEQFLIDQCIQTVDILKVDTEGSEVPILRSLTNYLSGIQVIYVEYHSDQDRMLIDAMMAGSHVLWRAHTWAPHRGEFCYVRRDLVPHNIDTPELSAKEVCKGPV